VSPHPAAGAAVDLAHAVTGPPGAPAVVLGSSLGTDRTMWDEQVAALSRSFRVVRYDHRGHGASPVPVGPYAIDDLGHDVLALMDHLGLASACHVGLSLGGMVALWLAEHAPERVEKVALVCSSAHLPPASGWRARAATVRSAGTGAVADAVTARWFTGAFASSARAAQLRAAMAATPAEGYAGCCEAIAAMDLRDDLPAIRAPTLVVSATEDPSIPAEHGRAIAAAVPGARYEELSPAAHLASVERAEDVTAVIRAHLAGPA
jgi:3-oxoadipate enol-lactonase